MTQLQSIVSTIQAENTQQNLPQLHIGDLVRIGVLIQEGTKQRVQPFEGTIIAQRKTGVNSTITLRKTLQGVSVERIFPLHAPCISNLRVLRRAQVGRAKLYYLRNRTGKATRLKQKFTTLPEPYTK